jgi:hypothetical protein
MPTLTERLRLGTNMHDRACHVTMGEAADEIERLRNELDAANARIERLADLNDRTIAAAGPFIVGRGGEERDGLPEQLHVCPTYGAEWSAVYQRLPAAAAY